MSALLSFFKIPQPCVPEVPCRGHLGPRAVSQPLEQVSRVKWGGPAGGTRLGVGFWFSSWPEVVGLCGLPVHPPPVLPQPGWWTRQDKWEPTIGVPALCSSPRVSLNHRGRVGTRAPRAMSLCARGLPSLESMAGAVSSRDPRGLASLIAP